MKKITFIIIAVVGLFSCSPEKRSESCVFNPQTFLNPSAKLKDKTSRIVKSVSYKKELIGQMIIVPYGEGGLPRKLIIRYIREKIIGGVLFLKGSKDDFIETARDFEKESRRCGGLPLLFFADAEPSLINMKILNTGQRFADTASLTNKSLARQSAERISGILNEIGVHGNFAPVADLNINRSVIGRRSFSDDPQTVKDLAWVFCEGMFSNGMTPVVKHFPGHGSVQGDSHKRLVTTTGVPPEVDIFKYLIDKGVPAIMVGHICIEGATPYHSSGLPATVSSDVISRLRRDLDFRGLIVTDAMNMRALKMVDNASYRAFEAGADLILWPPRPQKVVKQIFYSIYTADRDKNVTVKSSRMKKRLYDSVKKIIRLKILLGLF